MASHLLSLDKTLAKMGDSRLLWEHLPQEEKAERVRAPIALVELVESLVAPAALVGIQVSLKIRRQAEKPLQQLHTQRLALYPIWAEVAEVAVSPGLRLNTALMEGKLVVDVED